MPPQLYFHYSWGQYQNLRTGYYRKRDRQVEEQCQQTRRLLYGYYLSHTPSHKAVSEAEFWRLPSDPPAPKPSEKAGHQAFMSAFDSF